MIWVDARVSSRVRRDGVHFSAGEACRYVRREAICQSPGRRPASVAMKKKYFEKLAYF
jgi:hypothetical protein